MSYAQNQLTVDQKLFLATFIGGIFAVIAIVACSRDPSMNVVIYDGTAITTSCYLLGVIGLIYSFVAFNKNQEIYQELQAGSQSTTIARYWDEVKAANQRCPNPSQSEPLARLTSELLQSVKVPTIIFMILPAIGMVGTVSGLTQSFDGMETTVKTINPEEGAKMEGVINSFGGLKKAMISTAVALSCSAWLMTLTFFIKSQIKNYVGQVQRITAENLLPKLRSITSPEALAIEKVGGQLGELIKAQTQQQLANESENAKGFMTFVQQQQKLHELMENRLAGLTNLQTEANERLASVWNKRLFFDAETLQMLHAIGDNWKRVAEMLEEIDADRRRFPGNFGEDVVGT